MGSFHRQALKSLQQGQRWHFHSDEINDPSQWSPAGINMDALFSRGNSINTMALILVFTFKLRCENQSLSNNWILKPFLLHNLVAVNGAGEKSTWPVFPQGIRKG